MTKVLAAMIAGLFAAGAYAQAPGEKAQERAPVTDSQPQQRAEMKKDARGTGQVAPMGGDQKRVAEGSGGVTASKALDNGEARKNTRDARRGKKMAAGQGGTPK